MHSCGTVEPHGFRELTHPEKGFFIVGMKSYGRAPTFLLATGYEQVRSVTAWLAGDTASASNVELVLPATGVCSTDVERRGRMLLVTRDPQMTAADWPAVERIYAQGIEDGEATFEMETPTWDAFDAGKLAEPRLVAADEDGRVLGWVAASAVSARAAYRGVVEHSVYVDRDARGQGRRPAAAGCVRGGGRPGRDSGRSSRASSPRTPPACASTRRPDSASSAAESASRARRSVRTPGSGATPS